MDLGSTNGTFINNERLEAQRFYELMEKVGVLELTDATWTSQRVCCFC